VNNVNYHWSYVISDFFKFVNCNMQSSTQIENFLIKSKMKTILLIEDRLEILDNLKEFLELEGYHVIIANNGKLGIELVQQFSPDLIICDVLMPEMDGHEVLKKILDLNLPFRGPFIFSTSLSEKIDRIDTLKLGADDYIVKPYELDELLKMIKVWIDK
jgi:DNA-binding response OmpR family regulator